MPSEHKIGPREFRLPIGTRKHIRRLKEEGNIKEATLVRNAGIAYKSSVHQKPKAKPDGDSSS